MTCSIESCESPVRASGLCHMHYMRKWRYGDVMELTPKRPKMTVEERFWMKVNKHGGLPDYAPELGECWLWTASINEKGYGYFWYNGKTHKSHKFIYEFINGNVPDKMQLDHLCRRPRCIRPDHMEIVTNQENTMRGAVVKKYLRGLIQN